MEPMEYEDARICVVLVEDHPSSAEGLALELGTVGNSVYVNLFRIHTTATFRRRSPLNPLFTHRLFGLLS